MRQFRTEGLEVSEQSQTAPWPELSGRLSGAGHILPVRVYFEDTDFSGLVYHTSYLRWCERGRSDYLRLAGIHHFELAGGSFAGEPCAFAVRRIQADFLKPARIDEILEVHTSAGEITKASIVLNQTILREGQPIFRLQAQCVLISAKGRLLRLPAALTDLLPGGGHRGL
ncbi:MAG: YbgC/FadM family acyl-CoA thioesterase [Rhodomicrobium sp.]